MLSGDCNACINGKMPSYSATCVECGLSRKNYKPISHADRIRAMTDEELAKTMHSTGDCPPRECPYAYADLSENGGNITDKQCVECWLDWLKQEVET